MRYNAKIKTKDKDDSMKLYHGCSAKELPSIVTNGLCPRSDKESNLGEESEPS